MDYFAGLDISMDETHVCVLDRDGEVVHESSIDRAIADELVKAPSCSRIVFETGRMAPILSRRRIGEDVCHSNQKSLLAPPIAG
jgi:transposase